MSDKMKRYILVSIVVAVLGWYVQRWVDKT